MVSSLSDSVNHKAPGPVHRELRGIPANACRQVQETGLWVNKTCRYKNAWAHRDSACAQAVGFCVICVPCRLFLLRGVPRFPPVAQKMMFYIQHNHIGCDVFFQEGNAKFYVKPVKGLLFTRVLSRTPAMGICSFQTPLALNEGTQRY